MDSKSRRLEIEKRLLRRNRMEREIEAFNKLNELIEREKKLKTTHCENDTNFSTHTKTESKEELR